MTDPQQSIEEPYDEGLEIVGECHVCGEDLLRQDRAECDFCGESVHDECITGVKDRYYSNEM